VNFLCTLLPLKYITSPQLSVMSGEEEAIQSPR
jgi:hypothetical protein